MIQLELIMGIETLQDSPITIPLRHTLALLYELITPLPAIAPLRTLPTYNLPFSSYPIASSMLLSPPSS